MKSTSVLAALLGAVVFARPALPAHADDTSAPARRLTFEQAIALALGQNPEIADATDKLGANTARVAGLRAERLPNARVVFDGRLYESAYAVPFPGLGTFTLHDQFTSTTVASITQPLSGLAYVDELIQSAEHTENASHADYDRARLEVAYRAAEAYVRALETHASAEVAHASVTDIAGELDRAQKLRAADTYTDIDVLRFRSAKAAADQAALRADTAARQAQAQLVVQLGLHDGDAVELTDDLPPTPPQMTMTIEKAQERALAARPELRGARERIAAANNTRRAARDTYVPDVRAVGAWIHATGVQPFQPGDEEYIGVTVSWNVWDWGVTHAKVVAAERDQSSATIEAGALVDRVKVEVRTRWLDAKAGFDNLASAQTQLETAEEAMRLQRVRFDAGASTATDVLDAETEVARGRTQATVARYDYYLALVSLARAMGNLPDAK